MTGSILLSTRCIKNDILDRYPRYFSQEYQPKTLKKASRVTISHRTELPMAMQIAQSVALSGTVPKARCKNGV
jgi:hypothetical protein